MNYIKFKYEHAYITDPDKHTRSENKPSKIRKTHIIQICVAVIIAFLLFTVPFLFINIHTFHYKTGYQKCKMCQSIYIQGIQYQQKVDKEEIDELKLKVQKQENEIMRLNLK